jgi:hypothetical protein
MWAQFLKESIAFALEHGGRVALTQTRFVTREDYFTSPGNKPLVDAPNHRFTSAFFEQFVGEAGADGPQQQQQQQQQEEEGQEEQEEQEGQGQEQGQAVAPEKKMVEAWTD